MTSIDLILYIPILNENNKQKKGEIVLWLIQQNTNLYLKREDWRELGVLADKTNRTRSSMIGRLIRFFKDNKGNGKKNGK